VKAKSLFVLFSLIFFINSPLNGTEVASSSIQICQNLLETPPCVIVVFGATGDLSSRKLFPAFYHLAKERHLSENTVLVGVARKDLNHSLFRQQIDEAIGQFSRTTPIDNSFWELIKNKVFYHQAEFDKREGYENLQKFLAEIDTKFGTQGNRIYYLATPPSYFSTIVDQLHQQGLIYDPSDSKWSRVIIEKPYGTDFDSAIDLQEKISSRLHESQVFRIDHYLGKEGVQNLFALRFENHLFEPLWNHQHVDNIQITLSEDIGIGSRGNLWEETGALRDFFQNHLMQLLAIVAMEPPPELTAEGIHEEKMKVFKAIRPFSLKEIDRYVIRGQYDAGRINGNQVIGYRQEKGVSETSNSETYVAAKIFVDNERWKGIPFYIRGGKRLPKQTTEIVVTFKAKPNKASNVLFIRIQPNTGIFFKILTKVPGLHTERTKSILFGHTLDSTSPDAYEKLIYDSIRGDKSLFVDVNEQLAAWQLLTPILQHWQTYPPDNFPNYHSGSWGPEEADKMVRENGHQWELLELE
jgi:glucose-6-phosphate 1-dehydrogenase